MIMTLTNNQPLSEHFGSWEFNDCDLESFPLDDRLVQFLENIYTRCHARAIIITSGYRTVEEDKKVGGNGKGYHTKRMAVDFKVRGIDGHYIESKYLCCIAQDMGLKGIAKINDYAVHIDLRSNTKYYGDETKGNKSVTKNFYEYFTLSIMDVLKRVGV